MAPSNRVWIAEVRCSADVEEKLRLKHRLTIDEVRRAVLYATPPDAVWHHHLARGWRLIVRARHPDDGSHMHVILALLEGTQDVWICKTAMRTRR